MGQFTHEVTDASFMTDVEGSDKPVLVDFWAEWCGPCKQIAPAVDEIAKKYDGKLRVMKMDVDMNTETPGRFGIMGIPTLLVFKGGKEVGRIVGLRSGAAIEEEVKAHL